MANIDVNDNVLNVADKIGMFIEYWGFKAIHGKIWALIFLANKPVNAAYLVSALGVSKASISLSLRDLMKYNVILYADTDDFIQYYRPNENIAKVITDVLMNREARMLLEIKNSCELLDRVKPEDYKEHASKKRVEQLLTMTSSADQFLKTFLQMQSINLKGFENSLNLGDGR